MEKHLDVIVPKNTEIVEGFNHIREQIAEDSVDALVPNITKLVKGFKRIQEIMVEYIVDLPGAAIYGRK